MTPERRQEVGERLKLYKSGTPCKPQAAFAEVLRLFSETLADNDTLTTEIDRLKGEVERLKRENRRRAACDLVNDQFKRSIEDHEEREGRLKDELATLRTRLQSLVTAGEKGIDAYCALCDVLSDLPTCIEDIVEDYQTHSDNIDALAAAVTQAKELSK